MKRNTPTPNNTEARFPGFDVLEQVKHWDAATTAVVVRRLGPPPSIRFFSPQEEATASALFDQLLYQTREPRVPVVNLVDARLAENETDGWHFEKMPPDADAWRKSLAALEGESQHRHGRAFSSLNYSEQASILQAIYDLGEKEWWGLPAKDVWSLWTRYACSAFYSHPWAWNEISFDGPAYPRGYKNLGINRRESLEVNDSETQLDD